MHAHPLFPGLPGWVHRWGSGIDFGGHFFAWSSPFKGERNLNNVIKVVLCDWEDGTNIK